jgi:hypothetical protein
MLPPVNGTIRHSGARQRREPGTLSPGTPQEALSSHHSGPWLWIPGSPLCGAPE